VELLNTLTAAQERWGRGAWLRFCQHLLFLFFRKSSASGATSHIPAEHHDAHPDNHDVRPAPTQTTVRCRSLGAAIISDQRSRGTRRGGPWEAVPTPSSTSCNRGEEPKSPTSIGSLRHDTTMIPCHPSLHGLVRYALASMNGGGVPCARRHGAALFPDGPPRRARGSPVQSPSTQTTTGVHSVHPPRNTRALHPAP
jgi:hypothetical protein